MVFETYRLISQMEGRIVTTSPFRIGAGKGLKIMESDLPVVKNASDVPVIPGSSLKGFFRGTLQRLLKLQNLDENILDEMFGSVADQAHASALLFHELVAEKYVLSERKHIAIDLERGSVRRGGLFNVECVMDGATFSGKIFTARNLSVKGIAMLKAVMDFANSGLSKLGGFKSRGYGSVEFKVDKFRLILPGKTVEDLRADLKINGLLPKSFDTTRIKLKDNEVTVDNAIVEAEVKSAPSFFGVEIVVSGENVGKLFDEILESVSGV